MSKQGPRRIPQVSLVMTGLLMLNASMVFAAPPILSLDDSVAMALKNNSAIKIAAVDQDKARFGIDAAEAGRLPVLSLTSSDSRGNSLLGSDTANNFNTSLHISMPIYTGGRISGQIEQAKFNADAADLGVVKAEQQTKLDATTGYFSILQTRNMVQVNQETVDNMVSHLKNVQAQYNAGTVAQGDVLQSEVELANAQQNLTKAQNANAVAEASFNNTVGQALDTQSSYQDEFTYDPYSMTLDDSIKLALKNRPEIGQSQDSIAAAKAGVTIADSGRLPTVDITGGTGRVGSDFPGNNNWSVGVTANWNLFDSGLTKAQVEEAKTAVSTAAIQDKQIRDGIELEVRTDYLSMKEAEQRIQTSAVAVNQGADSLKIAEAKYAAGVGTNMDVIDAQLALTQAKTNATQALYDFNVDKAQLIKAVGSGAN
jgi:outer membrane protein TolC